MCGQQRRVAGDRDLAGHSSLLEHYSLRSTRINRGQSHENGVAEHVHYRLKDAIN